MTWLGTIFNAPWAGALIGILFPMWSFMFLVRRIPFFSRIVAIPYWITTLVLLITVPLFLIGFWSPEVKGSLNERSEDSKTWTANFWKKGSAHSERNAGVRGKTKSATEVYDDFNKPIAGIIPARRIIMVLNLKGKPATKDREALLPVMLPNKHGNFVDGERVWMPALKIEFINNEEQENSVSVAKNIPGESWELCLQRDDVPWRGNVELKKSDSQIKIKGTGEGGWFIYEGEKIGENQYQGNWKNFHSGEAFFLEFDPDQKTATGWFIGSESHKKKKMWLNKNV